MYCVVSSQGGRGVGCFLLYQAGQAGPKEKRLTVDVTALVGVPCLLCAAAAAPYRIVSTKTEVAFTTRRIQYIVHT